MDITGWTQHVEAVQRAYERLGDALTPDHPEICRLSKMMLEAMYKGDVVVDFGIYRRARRQLRLGKREAMRRTALITALAEVDRAIAVREQGVSEQGVSET